jgi:hypothetical protein
VTAFKRFDTAGKKLQGKTVGCKTLVSVDLIVLAGLGPVWGFAAVSRAEKM